MEVGQLNEVFTDRELKLLVNVLDYDDADYQAGLPGHNLMIIISKLLGVVNKDKADIQLAITMNELFSNEN